MLNFSPITEADVRQLVYWRYERPYDIYNILDSSDRLDDGLLVYFLDPAYNYHSIRDEAGHLVAFCSFGQDGQVPGGDYSAQAIDIGLGVRPDLTGRGRGLEFVSATIDFALNTFKPSALRVTIAQFNRRAQRVWGRAGFKPVQTFERNGDGMPFIVLFWAQESRPG